MSNNLKEGKEVNVRATERMLSLSDLALSVASLLCYVFIFLALFNSANTTADFKAKCLSENGEFTNGYVLIIPIQTCTYPKSTKT